MELEAEACPTLSLSGSSSIYAKFVSPITEPRSPDLKNILGFSPLLFESIRIQPTPTLDFEARPTG